jgi:uncharacterized protein YggU (UPF0235/DUF167 family)
VAGPGTARAAPILGFASPAPPIDGAANAALVALIAKALSRPARAVRIASGEHGRLKSLEIEGVDPADLQQAFGEPG